jgi:hypothetical protein
VKRLLVFFDLTFLAAGAHGVVHFLGRLWDGGFGLGLEVGRVARALYC